MFAEPVAKEGKLRL